MINYIEVSWTTNWFTPLVSGIKIIHKIKMKWVKIYICHETLIFIFIILKMYCNNFNYVYMCVNCIDIKEIKGIWEFPP